MSKTTEESMINSLERNFQDPHQAALMRGIAELGLIYLHSTPGALPDSAKPIGGGVQIDANVGTVMRNGIFAGETSVCNHNCTTEFGGYDCPASFTLPANQGMKPTYAGAHEMLQWILLAAKARQSAIEEYLDSADWNYFCDRRQIPDDIGHVFRYVLESPFTEVNLFGGNPEMNPAVPQTTSVLRELGMPVSMTTTGRRFMVSEEYRNEFFLHSPNIFALSADDVSIAELERLLRCSPSELFSQWKTIDHRWGQQQKLFEALWVAKFFKTRDASHEAKPDDPKILFNIVVSKQNITDVMQLICMLHAEFPNVIVNPYPAQTAFMGPGNEAGPFDVGDLRVYERLVDFMIRETLQGNENITKRIHYWIAMMAIVTSDLSAEEMSSLIGGFGFWQCYAGKGMGSRYVQVGRSSPGLISIDPAFAQDRAPVPGGHLGCFWNTETVNQSSKLTAIPQGSAYLRSGMERLAKQAAHPCPGCAMPRLTFDQPNFENGMPDPLWKLYHPFRKELLNF